MGDKTLIEYFLPENGEKEINPNIFVIKKRPEEITLFDIESDIPLKGNYYFRFKYSLKGKNYWLDFNNREKPVPVFENGRIIIKVNNLETEDPEDEY